MSSRYTRMREELEKQFAPIYCELVDESHLHAGHASAPAGGESHYKVTLVSNVFEGMSRPARHRAVYTALSEAMQTHVHALAIQAWTPDEYARRQAG